MEQTPSEDDSTMWTGQVPQELSDAGMVRRAAHDYLVGEGVGSEDLESVGVMFSELLTNAIAHGTPPRMAAVIVSPEVVLVEVDDGSQDVPEVLPRDPHRVGGNGMRIVDALADSWGVTTAEDDGKTVWFRVERTLAS